MRILQVTRVFHPNIGGIEKHVEWLSQALVKRGHTVDVVTLNRSFADGSRYPDRDALGAVNVYRVPYVGSNRYPVAPGVLKFVAGHDVVHVHAIDFLADWMLATRPIHRRPVVLSTHGGFFHTDFAPRLKRAWFQSMTRMLVSRVDRLLYTSDQDEERFRPITDRGTIIRSAVDLGPWRTLKNAPANGAWVTTGRVDTHKGIANLLRTLARVRDVDPDPFTVEIIGPDVIPGLMNDLTRFRDDLGLADRVHLRGKVPFDVMREAVRTAELGLFPSEYESFGLSVVEAMGAGVVPVCNDIRAFRYFVDEGNNGFIADYADPERAAAVIIRARALGEGRAVVSDAARVTAEKYDWDNVVGEIEAAYQGVALPSNR